MQSKIYPVKRYMIDIIADKDKECFTHGDDSWSAAMFESQLPDDRHIFLAVGPQEGPCGYICMSHVLDEAELVRIGVFPQYRGKGLGRALLHAGLAECARLGIAEVNLEVRQSNHTARALYEKLGFRPVGRRKNYYSKQGEDAVLMKLIIREGTFEE